ncbi:CLUMA_CG014803, isoform A [Clunio marinus]|uniref:CLUMA_CG014803, isoform A n=1 Tax=Clunio marinus TaxID=568069 RepID=A0A1J1IMV8_9DIPT|nr:CLUMA_CG014803, isoform A [Clunio marinus]
MEIIHQHMCDVRTKTLATLISRSCSQVKLAKNKTITFYCYVESLWLPFPQTCLTTTFMTIVIQYSVKELN